MRADRNRGILVLEDGSVFEGYAFGCIRPVAGEVVFNTGMVGYPESLTDPSYTGQILVLTYPLIGNYGVPASEATNGLPAAFESHRIHIAGLAVCDYSARYSHWNAAKSLSYWLTEHALPALAGVDTRAITNRLREKGTMLGKILFSDQDLAFHDPNADNLVSMVSVKETVRYGFGKTRVVLIDCGCKANIVRSLLARGLTVIRVPWNYDFLDDDFDAVVISNGPGDPTMCPQTVAHVRKAMEKNCPILGICLGHQILALAAGAKTYKLKFGHRSQNQPAIEVATRRCFITSQNHGYAVDTQTLPSGWDPWFINGNDGTNEGIRHRSLPFRGIQFHPEASPGPVDTGHLFDDFLSTI